MNPHHDSTPPPHGPGRTPFEHGRRAHLQWDVIEHYHRDVEFGLTPEQAAEAARRHLAATHAAEVEALEAALSLLGDLGRAAA